VGNYYTSYTVGAKIYDYDVTFMQASPYLQAEISPLQDLRFSGGARLDLMSFDYENKLGELLTGNWRRPESDTRTFHSLTPNIGATYAISPDLNVFARYAEAFRVPAESQLFRQGGNADSIHLRPIHARNVETGLRGAVGKEFSFELSAYRMIKADDILTSKDFAGNTSTNSGKTRHQGFELAADYRFLPDWRLQTAFSVAEHKYLDWVSSNGDYSGNIMSFAPAVTNTLTLAYTPSWLAGASLELEWVHMGEYYMDDANTQIYGGHELVNLRGNYAFTDYLGAFARIMNAGDARFATTAQFSSAKEQYVPGMPLAVYGGIEVKL
jgi:outer membrane receptor protein involved in Fe transport